MKYTKAPAISGKQLIKLLKKDTWTEKRRGKHGVVLIKKIGARTLVTVIPSDSESLPPGTLADILGPDQTNLGKKGLLELINKYGL